MKGADLMKKGLLVVTVVGVLFGGFLLLRRLRAERAFRLQRDLISCGKRRVFIVFLIRQR